MAYGQNTNVPTYPMQESAGAPPCVQEGNMFKPENHFQSNTVQPAHMPAAYQGAKPRNFNYMAINSACFHVIFNFMSRFLRSLSPIFDKLLKVFGFCFLQIIQTCFTLRATTSFQECTQQDSRITSTRVLSTTARHFLQIRDICQPHQATE